MTVTITSNTSNKLTFTQDVTVTTNQDPITMSGTNKTDMNVLFRFLTQPSMSNVMQNYLFKTRYLTKL